MGGQICIAIKKDGVESIFDAHTNPVPWLIADPEFRNGGKRYKSYLARASKENQWPMTRTVAHIFNSEYGLVLIDLDCLQVFSRNYYTFPGRIMASRYDQEGVAIIRKLVRGGDVSHLEYLDDNARFAKAAEATTKELGRLIRTGQMVTGILSPLSLLVDHQCRNPNKEDRRYISEVWLVRRGWKSTLGKPC